ncbi:MAG: phytanoyl-CoA dioxygenase family protein [Acidimicrobiales bacterium]|nr:phytanoyl-CoA dioxygenase family protein [Acidimicrobiales bacterium]
MLGALTTLRRSYEDDGFAIARDVVDVASLTAVRTEIDEVLAAEAARHLDDDVVDDGTRSDRWYLQLAGFGRAYREALDRVLEGGLAAHAVALAEDLVSCVRALDVAVPNLRVVTVRADPPGGERTLLPLHQDVRDLRSENAVNAWIPLQPVDTGNGAMVVHAGSHRRGRIESTAVGPYGHLHVDPGWADGFDPVACQIEPGDAVLFSPYVLHRSAPNASRRIRWTVVVRYDDASRMPWLVDGRNPHR